MRIAIPSLQQIATALGGDVSGDQVLAPGPGHGPKDRSLSVKLSSTAPGGFLAWSFAGDDEIACKDYVRERCGLPEWGPQPRDPVVTQYVYKQPDGTPYLRVARTQLKRFWQQHWDGATWVKGVPKGPKIPYRLPDLTAAAGEPVFVCEGEKDADRLASVGLVATSAFWGRRQVAIGTQPVVRASDGLCDRRQRRSR